MKYLTNIFEHALFGLFILSFSFVCLYVPHNYNPVKTVEAGGLAGGSTELTQVLNKVQLLAVNAATTISAGADTTTALMTTSSFVLNNLIDGIAWSLAKSILSQITASVLQWVNSGFKGSPTFVTDMKGLLLDAADKEFGQFLNELGGPFSFVCSPFKLDVQVALAVAYDHQRANGGVSGPTTCTLTGALENLEGFLDQTKTFADGGGWDAWFQITANPNKYTSYGELLSAKAQVGAKIINAKGEEVNLLSFGQGFLSTKLCEEIEGAGNKKEKCKITTPGKVINEALTFQTSTGQRSLIEADEINEIIAAVFAQLTTKAISGAAGLLGLSPGTGYTDYSDGTSFVDKIVSTPPTVDPSEILSMMEDSLSLEIDYKNNILLYGEKLLDFISNPLHNEKDRANAQAAYDELSDLTDEVNSNIDTLNSLIDEFNSLSMDDSSSLQTVSSRYFKLKLHTEAEIDGQVKRWEALLRSV